MRRVGELPTEQDAITFHALLLTHGIECSTEPEDGGAFSIWVHDEEQIPAAGQWLARYRGNPGAEEFRDATAKAARLQAETAKADRRRRSTVIDEARVGYERNITGLGWVTITLMVITIAVTAYTGFMGSPNANPAAVRRLQISEVQFHQGIPGVPALLLPEVRAGQVWRLISPIFLHGDEMHILFNMMWLFQLGRFIETRFGPWKLLAIILAVGIGSNLAEYLWSLPYFGGMSGVNYGLFGFLWMKGKFGRDLNWQLEPQIIHLMLAWMALCYTGMFGPVANAAHTVGLLIGAALGFASARLVPWLQGGGR